MAKSVTTDAGTIYIPGGYSKYSVVSNPSSLATTGVLMLVGEADGGPRFDEEEDLENNAFTPDQVAEVVAKYSGGALVDAFRGAVEASSDEDIAGAFSYAILVKTNEGVKASGTLPAIGGGSYADVVARSYGATGNNIYFRTQSAVAEIVPTTGAFTFIPPVGAVDYRIRVNGGAALGGTIPAACTPAAFQALIEALVGVTASGGANRSMLTGAGGRSVAFTASGATLSIAVTGGVWDTTPTVGDTFVIPMAAPAALRGAGDANVGAYVVTAASSASLGVTKLSDYDRTGAVPGTITSPVSVPVTALGVTAPTDLQAFGSVTVSMDSGAVISGAGKALEIAELTTGADLLSRTMFNLGTAVAVSWVSKAASAKLVVSGAEYQVTMNVNDAATLANESFTEGGEVALKIGYAGDTATMVLTDDTLTTTVTGGVGGVLSINLNAHASIQALADFIASQPGYTCTVGTAALGQLPPYALDDVSISICGQFASQPGRVKIDGYRFYEAVSQGSALIQLNDPETAAASGLPDAMSVQTFLVGGELGGTTDADVQEAYAALENVRGNFLIPCFSRDAAEDKLDGLTDTASTYTIAAIHAMAKSHVSTLSTMKRRKNRQAFLSIATDFDTSKETAANLASARVSCAFQDMKAVGSTGSIEQFLPWMTAAKAAGLQAAGFYKNIEYKQVNCSGVLSRVGDFNPKNDGQVEQALKAGLLIARPALSGGYIFVSDQTTYGKDSNFVFNSIQAIYAADVCALTMAQRMEDAMVGQSVADVSAPVARSFAEGVLADFLALKLIAPSDDGAPKGWKNLNIQLRGNVLLVSVEIKLATAIDFVLINFQISSVTQNA